MGVRLVCVACASTSFGAHMPHHRWNKNGQLGTGDTTNSTKPTQVALPTPVGVVTGATSSSGVICRDGTLLCAGNLKSLNLSTENVTFVTVAGATAHRDQVLSNMVQLPDPRLEGLAGSNPRKVPDLTIRFIDVAMSLDDAFIIAIDSKCVYARVRVCLPCVPCLSNVSSPSYVFSGSYQLYAANDGSFRNFIGGHNNPAGKLCHVLSPVESMQGVKCRRVFAQQHAVFVLADDSVWAASTGEKAGALGTTLCVMRFCVCVCVCVCVFVLCVCVCLCVFVCVCACV